MSKLLVNLNKRAFLIKEESKDDIYYIHIYPFFNDLQALIKEIFKSFDEYIKYDISIRGGCIQKIINKKRAALFESLKLKYKYMRKPWKRGQQFEWYKYVFIINDKQEFWNLIYKYIPKHKIEVMPDNV